MKPAITSTMAVPQSCEHGCSAGSGDETAAADLAKGTARAPHTMLAAQNRAALSRLRRARPHPPAARGAQRSRAQRITSRRALAVPRPSTWRCVYARRVRSEPETSPKTYCRPALASRKALADSAPQRVSPGTTNRSMLTVRRAERVRVLCYASHGGQISAQQPRQRVHDSFTLHGASQLTRTQLTRTQQQRRARDDESPASSAVLPPRSLCQQQRAPRAPLACSVAPACDIAP